MKGHPAATTPGPVYPWCAGQPSETMHVHENAGMGALLRWPRARGRVRPQARARRRPPARRGAAGSDIHQAPSGEENVQAYDLHRTGKPDVWVYSVTAQDASGRPVERRVRKEVDLNGDGRVDIVYFFDADEQVTKETLDLDFDGKVDDTSTSRRARRSARSRTSTATAGSTPGSTTRRRSSSARSGTSTATGRWTTGSTGRTARSTASARTSTATARSTAGPRAATPATAGEVTTGPGTSRRARRSPRAGPRRPARGC